MLVAIRKNLKQGKTLLRFAVLKTLGQVIFLGLPLFVAKFLAPEEFGSYSLGMMIVFLFTAILVKSVSTPFIKYGNEEINETGKANKTFTVGLVFLVVAMAIFFLIAFVFDQALISFIGITGPTFLFILLAFVGVCVRIFS